MDDQAFNTESVAADTLKSGIERIERKNAEKDEINADISEIYKELKGLGFNTKVVKKIVALRKRDYSERQEEEAIMDLYLQALGMAG